MFKQLILVVGLSLAVLQFSISSMAAVGGNDNTTYRYNYNFKGEAFTFSKEAHPDQKEEEIFEKAAFSCYKNYTQGKNFTEDEKLDVIDICANPKKG